MKSFIFFLVVVGVVALLALNFHIVKTKEGTLYVKKDKMTFEDTFISIAGWGPSKFEKHELLEYDLLAAGHEKIVNEIKYPKKKAKAGIEHAPVPPPSSSDILLESGSQGSGSGQRLKDKAKSVRGK